MFILHAGSKRNTVLRIRKADLGVNWFKVRKSCASISVTSLPGVGPSGLESTARHGSRQLNVNFRCASVSVWVVSAVWAKKLVVSAYHFVKFGN